MAQTKKKEKKYLNMYQSNEDHTPGSQKEADFLERMWNEYRWELVSVLYSGNQYTRIYYFKKAN